MTNKFNKTPLSKEEKEKKAEEFLNFNQEKKSNLYTTDRETKPKLKKEEMIYIKLRIPENYRSDLQEIMDLTGISMNAICLELLRPGIKNKLKELKDN